MAIIKCKMCGGDLNLIEGKSVAECEYCGSIQTVPTVDNERKLNLFARANRLRSACEFDKAAGIYETIVSDFPEEAEAYWGLVLCKYGIEYVDDPATGKKIPTCHRSSFDSVMDDSNFEQAMENTDEVALRVYRAEAKQLEELRKGILQVSSSEKPYDIFICYKETDSSGNRTVDSLLAQDIYDALTAKGYRVFFSRITLEDKLGQAYEPYIFAALNSAKIMLAVGTCYDHYNAVWVKNEWSRYLKIIAQDKGKYLIPCYKGIDAYSMPKEFAHLQGQDMGKIGAIQDLLRGIEKLCGKYSPATEASEKTIPHYETGNNRIHSLLNLGMISLEDKEWSKANGYFEEVLHNDYQNAQAYIGITLAREQCGTLEELVGKRLKKTCAAHTAFCTLQLDTSHVEKVLASIDVDGYSDKQQIRKMYAYNPTFPSSVASRMQQYQEETAFWQNHKELSRAEKYARGDVAEILGKEKRKLFSELKSRVERAEEKEAEEKAALQLAYEKHLAETDQKVEELRAQWTERREKDYSRWLTIAKTEQTQEQILKAKQFFESQGNYRDSRALAEHCKKRIEDLKIQEELRKKAEREARQREINAQYMQEQKKQNRFHKCVWLMCGLGAVVMAIAMTQDAPGDFGASLFGSAIVQIVLVGPTYLLVVLADKWEDSHPGLCRVFTILTKIVSLFFTVGFGLTCVVGLLTIPEDFLLCCYFILLGLSFLLIYLHLRKSGR